MQANISRVLLITVLLFAVNACRQNSADLANAEVKPSNALKSSGQAAPTPPAINGSVPKITDGTPVPAKTEKLPVAKSPGISVCAEGSGGNGLEIKDIDFEHMQPVHAAILKRWLCFQKTNLRPLREEKNSLSSQEYFRRDHPNDDPFYAVGDFNKDGSPDFVVMLAAYAPPISPDTKRTLNALAIFEVPAATKEDQPKAAFFSDQIDSLFIIAGREENTLAIASYPSDDGFLLVPKGKTYTAKAMVDF